MPMHRPFLPGEYQKGDAQHNAVPTESFKGVGLDARTPKVSYESKKTEIANKIKGLDGL